MGFTDQYNAALPSREWLNGHVTRMAALSETPQLSWIRFYTHQPSGQLSGLQSSSEWLCMGRQTNSRYIYIYKGKAFPLQAWSGPEDYRKLRYPDFMITAQDGAKVVSLTHQPPLLPGNTPGTHFC